MIGKNFGGETARHAFEFGLAHALRIADHAALAAAKGNVHGGGFPGHPSRERFHFVERDTGVIADAAFGGAARDVVLHAKAGEDFHLAVVHLGRDGNFQDALRGSQNLAHAGIELQVLGGDIELDLRDAVRIQIFARSNPRRGLKRARLGNDGHLVSFRIELRVEV